MKKWMSRLKNWVCRMIVVLAMVIGLAANSNSTFAQCSNESPNNVLRVDASQQTNTPDGRSWDCAFQDLQEALDEAENSEGEFDTLWVAASTYTPTEQFSLSGGDTAARKVTFKIPTGITVLGGFPAGGGNGTITARDPTTNVTILSGELGSAGPSDNAYHVLVITGNTEGVDSVLIDGFTITDGNADGTDYNTGGGGVHIHDQIDGYAARPAFTNCIFTNNHADNTGGAMLLRKSGALLRHCEFRNNTAGGEDTLDEYQGGGAITAFGPLHVIRCKFVTNECAEDIGGAINNLASTKLVDCEFYGNSATAGGAVYTSSGEAVSSVFAGNQATDGSGGALIGGSVHACTFADNYASGLGGGASSLTQVTNSIFWGNEACGDTEGQD